MSVRQRRLATALVVVLATVISVWLRLRGRAWLIADMVYDDALFTRSAGQLIQGNWLGPYDMLTLSKGPTYPLFIAGAYELHIPLKLAEHGLHLFAAGMLAWAVWRVDAGAGCDRRRVRRGGAQPRLPRLRRLAGDA